MAASLPPSSSASRERVIAATILLMRRAGYAGVGLNDILSQAGAPKGSLYHHFPEGKRQITREAMDAYADQAIALYGQAIAGPGTPGQKVKRLLKLPASRLLESDFDASCMGGTLSLDLDEGLQDVRTSVQAFFERMIDLLAKGLGIADGRRARSFAGMLLTTIEGAYVRGRAERSTRAFDESAVLLAEIADALARC